MEAYGFVATCLTGFVLLVLLADALAGLLRGARRQLLRLGLFVAGTLVAALLARLLAEPVLLAITSRLAEADGRTVERLAASLLAGMPSVQPYPELAGPAGRIVLACFVPLLFLPLFWLMKAISWLGFRILHPYLARNSGRDHDQTARPSRMPAAVNRAGGLLLGLAVALLTVPLALSPLVAVQRSLDRAGAANAAVGMLDRTAGGLARVWQGCALRPLFRVSGAEALAEASVRAMSGVRTPQHTYRFPDELDFILAHASRLDGLSAAGGVVPTDAADVAGFGEAVGEMVLAVRDAPYWSAEAKQRLLQRAVRLNRDRLPDLLAFSGDFLAAVADARPEALSADLDVLADLSVLMLPARLSEDSTVMPVLDDMSAARLRDGLAGLSTRGKAVPALVNGMVSAVTAGDVPALIAPDRFEGGDPQMEETGVLLAVLGRLQQRAASGATPAGTQDMRTLLADLASLRDLSIVGVENYTRLHTYVRSLSR